MQGACKEFVTVWGNYIDAGKTIPEGRRVPKAGACECHDTRDDVAWDGTGWDVMAGVLG